MSVLISPLLLTGFPSIFPVIQKYRHGPTSM